MIFSNLLLGESSGVALRLSVDEFMFFVDLTEKYYFWNVCLRSVRCSVSGLALVSVFETDRKPLVVHIPRYD